MRKDPHRKTLFASARRAGPSLRRVGDVVWDAGPVGAQFRGPEERGVEVIAAEAVVQREVAAEPVGGGHRGAYLADVGCGRGEGEAGRRGWGGV